MSDILTLDIFSRCADLECLRTWVLDQEGIFPTSSGKLWLPLVHTFHGTLYAEVISQINENQYHQPFHLNDQTKQPLYRLGYNLISWLQAPPAVYLLQFALELDQLLFDRLLPAPTAPAIASVGVQEPNLYECHLLCTTNQPIYDLVIKQP
jgi:hypothetical protein